MAAVCGGEVLRDVPFETFLANIPACRKQCGDRAVLRAFHFYADNDRVPQQVAEPLSPIYGLAFIQMLSCTVAETANTWPTHPLLKDYKVILNGKSTAYQAYDCT